MSATIFLFPTVRVERGDESPPALTVREALAEIALELAPLPVEPHIAEAFADELISKLWEHGFIVVPANDKVTR